MAVEIDMIYLGADHRGFALKEALKQKLTEQKLPYQDLGNIQLDPEDDYVDFANKVAEATIVDEKNRGILICGSGNGMAMVANKIPGVRAALTSDVLRAKQARLHLDANIACLPADILNQTTAWEIVEAFLESTFASVEKYQRRIQKLAELERLHMK